MITVRNLHKRFGPRILLDGVSFHLRPGDRMGLVGENGTGKTTLFRILMGKETHDAGELQIRKGIRIGLLEQELDGGEETVLERVIRGDDHFRRLQDQIEHLQQDHAGREADPEGWARRYGELQHAFELCGGYHREASAQAVLAGLGFRTEQMHRPLTGFSGGWRMRVELARLLLQHPDVLLLDEPTNHLDLQSVIWLEDFLKNYEGSLFLISHDRRFLNTLVSRIADLDRGRLTVYAGNYDAFEAQKRERQEQQAARAANQQRRIAELERFIERFRAKNTKATQAKSKQKLLDKMERVQTATQTKAPHFRFPQPPRTGRIVLDLKNVRKAYGTLTVYEGLNLRLERGARVALVGANGTGKSTLLKLMAGVLSPDGGEVVPGHNVTRAYFAQRNLDLLNPEHTVMESLEEVAGGLLLTQKRNILGAFLFSGNDVEKTVSVLSGGEKSRLALARLLARPAPVLLLDEPTNHLDIRSCEMLAAALSDFEGTLVTISHDRFFLDGIVNTVWEVGEGGVRIFPGTYSDYERARAQETRREAGPAASPATPASKSRRDKERKRQEAEARNARYRKLKPLEERLAEIEIRLEEGMRDQQSLQERLADPAIYQDANKQDLLEVLARQKQLRQEEAALMEEWDRLMQTIEAIKMTESSA